MQEKGLWTSYLFMYVTVKSIFSFIKVMSHKNKVFFSNHSLKHKVVSPYYWNWTKILKGEAFIYLAWARGLYDLYITTDATFT